MCSIHLSKQSQNLFLLQVRKHQLLLPHSNCVHFYQSWEERGRLYQQFELCETSLMQLAESEHEMKESRYYLKSTS